VKNIFAALTLLLVLTMSAYASEVYELWDKILNETVSDGYKNGVELTVVDYRMIMVKPEYTELLETLSRYRIADLESRDERLAFWINVYNIAAVKMIIDSYPIESIRKAGNIFRSVWNRDIIDIGGELYTLGQIEHDILREYDEPRIHFAIVCASVSCPDLADSSYRAATLDEQLNRQTMDFLKNSGKGLRIDRANNTIHISRIFKWFEKDFGDRDGVLQFIDRYLGNGYLQYRVRYLNYDWDLNE
jgi:hypothetical protein